MESHPVRQLNDRGTRHFPFLPSQPMTSLVPNLQAAMDIRGISQSELSRKLVWSEAKLSRLMNGKQKGVTVATLLELQEALGVSLAFLMNIEDVAQTDAERALLAGYRKADQRDQALAESALKPRD